MLLSIGGDCTDLVSDADAASAVPGNDNAARDARPWYSSTSLASSGLQSPSMLLPSTPPAPPPSGKFDPL